MKIRSGATLVTALALALVSQLGDVAPAAEDDEPSIAIRPFGAAPPPEARASADAAWNQSVVADAVGAEPVAIAIDARGGKLYWSEQTSGRIRRANLDGSDAQTVLEGIDAPVALALDVGDDRIYWATDGNFPRKMQRARLDGSERETLVMGENLNRPGALALNVPAGRMYWIESVSGRIRRADLDGSSIETVHEERILTSFGLAVEPATERMYWTDLTHAKIRRALLDGGRVDDVLDERAGLDVPMGLALDEAAGQIYWTDRGTAALRRAKADGSQVHDLITPSQGLIDPRAVALDVVHGKVYWSDLASDEIRVANLDGSAPETIVSLESGFTRTIVPRLPSGAAAGAARACRDALESSGRRFARATYKRLTTCLDKMSWVKAVKWRAVDPALAAATCARALAPFAPSAEPAPERAELTAALEGACTQVEALRTIELDGAKTTCGTDPAGSASARAWIDCVARRYESLVLDAVAARYTRALEWLEEARPFVRALEPAGAQVEPGLAGLDKIYAAIAERAPKPAARKPGFPATGLVTAYAADKNDGVDGSVPVADDGQVQAGAVLSFRDNGDGTITDLNTGLMWEKKCDGCGGLHDSLFGYRWSGGGGDETDTIWDWVDDLNAEGGKGFAGYSDWRIPNVKELVSIVNYERFNPAVSTPFDGALCGLGCNDVHDPECSCTASGPYWSATTFSDFPAHALTVLFNLGLLGDDAKTMRHFVRAVRGPVR